MNDAATLERVRTFLATHAPPDTSGGPGIAATPPRTYGEAVAIRSGRADVLQRLVYLAVDLTLLVAGCSLAVALGGGLVDRKRPFTLLRVSGTPVRALYRVVFLEAVVPLAAATVLAAAIAYGASILTVVKLAPRGHADTAARPRVLRHHGRRAGHRPDRDRRDAAPAQAHDRPRQRALRVTHRTVPR